MRTLDLGEMNGLLNEINEIEVDDIHVPNKIRIPFWPEVCGKMEADLGERDFYYPVNGATSGLLRFEYRTDRIVFVVEMDGTFDFKIGRYQTSRGVFHDEKIGRARTLLLFHQFKMEIFAKLIAQIKTDLPGHVQVLERVKRAFDPFLPYSIADIMSS